MLDSKKTIEYWSRVPPTVNGMLGGLGFISEADIKDSRQLLKMLFSQEVPPGRTKALDCGAGIGRITKFLLSNYFDEVDLLEQNVDFLKYAQKTYLGATTTSKVTNYYNSSLQDFQMATEHYDVIWIQWVTGYLTDDQLIEFLHRCRLALKPNGLVIVKENTASSDCGDLDESDHSITRSLNMFLNVFEKAQMSVMERVPQRNFPVGLYTVYMFVLRPSNFLLS